MANCSHSGRNTVCFPTDGHMEKELLILLRCALWGEEIRPEEFSPDASHWEGILREAKQQEVAALCFEALGSVPQKCRPPREVGAAWLVETARSEKHHKLLHDIARAQHASWERSGIKGLILKGESVGQFYPRPERRTGGDIDWYFPSAADWDKALEIARAAGCSPERDSDGDCHYLWNGAMIEHHRGWCLTATAATRKYLRGLEEQGYSDMDGIPILRPEVNLLMLNMHILKHVLVKGVELKQLCDYAMALKALRGSYRPEDYRAAVKKCGLLKWTELLHCLVTSDLGLDKAHLPWPVEKRRSTATLLQTVWGAPFTKRFVLYMQYAPGEWLRRILGLIIGRIKR